jgi:hypothetical protein
MKEYDYVYIDYKLKKTIPENRSINPRTPQPSFLFSANNTVQYKYTTKHALRTLSKGYTTQALSPSQPTQPARHSTNLRCCLDDTRTCRRFDSIGLRVRLARRSRAAGPCAAQSARPTSALCDEVVVQLQQLLGLQADTLECAFQGETTGRGAATHG